MEIRLIVALIGLAISFISPTFAQKEDTVDPQLRQMIDTFAKKYAEAVNNNDAATLATFYAEDGVFVTDKGLVYGRKAIEKFYSDLFRNIHFSNYVSKADQYSPHIISSAGDRTWETGEWSCTIQVNSGPSMELKGYYSSIDTREGDDWKISMVTSNTTPP
jgi:ketosteroid isomerase-like protein